MNFLKIDKDVLGNKKMSPTDKLILAVLRDKRDLYKNEMFYCYEDWIANYLSISRSTVTRSIDRLVELNEIEVYRQYNENTKKNCNYFKVF